MRRFVAIVALLGLLAAPVQSRTQHVCKYSGEELSGCSADDSFAPGSPILVSESCCVRNQLTALAQARPGPQHDQRSLAPLLLALPVALAREERLPSFAPIAAIVPRASGPPIFLLHRALLN